MKLCNSVTDTTTEGNKQKIQLSYTLVTLFCFQQNNHIWKNSKDTESY